MLRRKDKHPNARGALDLGLNTELNGLEGLCELADDGRLRAAWISFHPQLVDEDSEEIVANLERLISGLEFSVVSTTHEFEWAQRASILLPMAAWSEEEGTYTNFAGRIQFTGRAAPPPGTSRPLYRLMAEMLRLAGKEAGNDPATIFDGIAASIPLYAGIDYAVIGPLGTMPAGREAVEEPEKVIG